MAQLTKKQLRKRIPAAGAGRKRGRTPPLVVKRAAAPTWAVEKDLAIVEQRIQEKLKPYAAEFTLLDEIPGVDAALAGAIIGELGVDMSVFENVSQLASWAGVCPGNNEPAGKRGSRRIRL